MGWCVRGPGAVSRSDARARKLRGCHSPPRRDRRPLLGHSRQRRDFHRRSIDGSPVGGCRAHQQGFGRAWRPVLDGHLRDVLPSCVRSESGCGGPGSPPVRGSTPAEHRRDRSRTGCPVRGLLARHAWIHGARRNRRDRDAALVRRRAERSLRQGSGGCRAEGPANAEALLGSQAVRTAGPDYSPEQRRNARIHFQRPAGPSGDGGLEP